MSQVQHSTSLIFVWSNHMSISYVNKSLDLLWRVLKLITHVGYLILRQVFGVLCQIWQGVTMDICFFNRNWNWAKLMSIHSCHSELFSIRFLSRNTCKRETFLHTVVVMLLQVHVSPLTDVEWMKHWPSGHELHVPKQTTLRYSNPEF